MRRYAIRSCAVCAGGYNIGVAGGGINNKTIHMSRGNRRKTTQEERTMIADKYEWICQLCKRQIIDKYDLSLDHIIPLSKGGEDILDNMQATHVKCNVLKGDGEFDLEKYNEDNPLLPDIIPCTFTIGDLIKKPRL